MYIASRSTFENNLLLFPPSTHSSQAINYITHLAVDTLSKCCLSVAPIEENRQKLKLVGEHPKSKPKQIAPNRGIEPRPPADRTLGT